ncbi:Annexin [Heracleum sosnowskyi]|uniref:Annexin n=1 Tax=Heracleum sosnowskyi TaxID=360622 RepID=A0AAD8IGB1_9APIA|nr:Annexin [Heracleum sosnowskyi]
MSTVMLPPTLGSPSEDASDLHKAFKGFGCDTAIVVNILAHRDLTQRGLIQHEYRLRYSKELSKRVSSELTGDVKKAVLLWLQDPATRDATLLKKALREDRLNLRVATEIICSRTSSQIQQLKPLYFNMYRVYLEHEIEHQTHGHHKKMLLKYLATPRYEGPEVDQLMAGDDARALYKAGEKRLGTDEKTFIRIFCERSRAHLAAISEAYLRLYEKPLEKAVKHETSGHFEYALVTVLNCAENPGKYYAKVLRKAMKGLGTDEKALTRVIVTRAEVDMQFIKSEYMKNNGKTLYEAVRSETSGHYKNFLLAIIGPD